MAIYAISDLHLSLGGSKPMDVFGPAWTDHAGTIQANWDALVRDNDTVLLPGDLSWAMRLPEAMPDLDFIAERPGTKILVRGNHDYWWQRRATTRIQRTVDRNLVFLQGSSIVVGDVGITGTRGWRVDWETRDGRMGESGNGGMGERGNAQRSDANTEDPTPNTDDEGQSERILRRELDCLERGLRSIPESARLKIAMLHFPPFDERLRPNEFAEMLSRYSVDILVYGHVHLGLGGWIDGVVDGVQYRLVSADVVDFVPQIILP